MKILQFVKIEIQQHIKFVTFVERNSGVGGTAKISIFKSLSVLVHVSFKSDIKKRVEGSKLQSLDLILMFYG